jgi:dimeric dUTPase (all-alpha-NTP-PPase superfamily)
MADELRLGGNKVDKLEKMFEVQKQLQNRLKTFDKIENEQDKQQFINQMTLAIFEETVEMIKKSPYKNPNYVKFGWKQTQKWDVEMFKMELIDIFHFMMNLSIVVGMDAEEFFKVYINKNNENHIRQDNNY